MPNGPRLVRPRPSRRYDMVFASLRSGTVDKKTTRICRRFHTNRRTSLPIRCRSQASTHPRKMRAQKRVETCPALSAVTSTGACSIWGKSARPCAGPFSHKRKRNRGELLTSSLFSSFLTNNGNGLGGPCLGFRPRPATAGREEGALMGRDRVIGRESRS